MVETIAKVKIEMGKQAHLALLASRLDHCRAYDCKNWYDGDCSLKEIYISETGGCGYYKPKDKPEQENGG